MSKYRVLVTAEIDKEMLKPLTDTFDFSFHGYGVDHTMLSHDELKKMCKNTDILVCEFDTIDEDIMSSCPIKLIVCCRGGVSSVIDLNSAKKHGIIVCNNVGRNKDATADFTIGLIYDLMRNITLSDRVVHSSRIESIRRPMPKEYKDSLWGLDGRSPYVMFRGPSTKEVTIGVIGYGQIGRAVTERLEKLGFNYMICTRHPPEGDSRFVDMNKLLRESDIVTLHISGNTQKMPIIGSTELAMMKKSAYLINTSRGYLVDEDSLYNALKTNTIAGAAADVMIKEPMDSDDRMLTLDNLIITPHIAGSSRDTILSGSRMVVDALRGFISGNIPNRVI